MRRTLPPPPPCPMCESDNTDIDWIEEDRFRYGGHNEGHYTKIVGCACNCTDCGHQWGYEDDGPDYDPYDKYDHVDDDDCADLP